LLGTAWRFAPGFSWSPAKAKTLCSFDLFFAPRGVDGLRLRRHLSTDQ
jgi:hypothetical protein